ncbi:hypothetical protein N7520_004258 [Penicillium odoratum]|uniref:uncharacterized protein n=1 Tax=Penicillium odoratum TaxID=1167516 RepID=UPI0025494F56|nr:uncharacterized protein N7520_004258 [Penicillium odoratum]KAJ5769699.1 hypothetical protein N7520_004258 [Penicillium odoratum]
MAPQIVLHSWATPNGVKASIALEELGLLYKNEPVNIHTNEQKKEPYLTQFKSCRWFLKINPNGRIPGLVDNENRIFESGAILLYLTDRTNMILKGT